MIVPAGSRIGLVRGQHGGTTATVIATNQTILVVGGGISGMTAALEAAECGMEINRKQGTKFDMPVLHYSQLTTIACGGSAKDAGLDGPLIKAPKLEEIAACPAKG